MILVGLGANLEFGGRSPVQNMENALAVLDASASVSVIEVSPWYRTAPVGKVEQPDYVNGVAVLESGLGPLALMALLLDVERAHGRIREERWGPRTLDLDLLDYNGQVLDIEEGEITLHLPHPRLEDRAFVLQPLNDLAPAWRHPVSRLSAAEALTKVGPDQAIEPVAPAPDTKNQE